MSDEEKEIESSRSLEWFKHVNELIGKLSYPVVILVLVFYIVENAQFHSLLNKLTGAKIGDAEFTFQAIEDEAETNAKLNAQVQELLRKTKQLEKDIQLVVERNNKLTTEEKKNISERAEKEQNYSNNAKYSILVFNRPSQIVVASQIVDLLLNLGYSASRTTTDLSELSNPLPPGTVFITRNPEGNKVVDSIIEKLKTMNPNIVIHKQEAVQPLRRGNVQISLF